MVRPVRFQLAFTYHTVSILRVYVADAYHCGNTIGTQYGTIGAAGRGTG